MTLTVEFTEDWDSRPISISRDSFSQDFAVWIYGNFLDEAIDSPLYGPDDDVVALEAAYSIVPPFRIMPMYDGGLIVLTLSQIRISRTQANTDTQTWKLEVTYDVDSGGGGAGGGNVFDQDITEVGPNKGESKWSNEYVQLSCNVSAVQELRKMSRMLIACHKPFGATNTNIPYTIGKAAPIGHTIDGVEGVDDYARNFTFGITAYFPPRKLNFRYIRTLERLITCINSKVFFGFSKGSVRFLEAAFSSDVYQNVPVSFDFQIKKNFVLKRLTASTPADPDQDNPDLNFDILNDPYFPDSPGVGDSFTYHSGWSTLDYRYNPVQDNTAKMALQRPSLRCIHLNALIGDFDKLQL